MGRLTSETNPENATTTYVYDTDSTCLTSNGDLVKRTDAVGNVTCAAYDTLHRPTSITYPSGTYAANTPAKHFVYDAATVNSLAMSYVKGRLAEAYTCTGSCTSKATDEGFSYTVRGETSDVYESTAHSSGYYHSAATYWANGVVNQLTAAAGYLAQYNLDGEGRVYSTISADEALSGTTYNAASQPTQLTFWSADTDNFTYDPNTNRMTQYKYTVNSQSVIGTPAWNANGTLAQLAITDPFNSANAQTCTYSHDDLTRIASANCGSAANQTFSYDAFGNINKSGSPYNFQPNYNSSTNRMSLIGGSTPSYDANGNVLNDFLHSYTWDSNGRPLTIDGDSVAYDALGRMVEEYKGGFYSQFVYAPTGAKIEIMNGQSYVKAFVPLPGGAVAVYTPAVQYYRHPDHLGSSRFASTRARTMYSDVAYAPFGEPYAQAGATDVSFTGQNQDTVSNLYDFPAREYGIQGRWPSPDPAGLAAVDLTDPQSWNRYSYVRNSPLNLTDPSGMVDCQPGEACWNDPGESFCDVMGCSLWDGRPTIGLGGTTHQFDLLTIPVTSGPRYGWLLTFSSGPSWTADINGVPGLTDGNYQVTSSIGGWSWGLLQETVVGNGFDFFGDRGDGLLLGLAGRLPPGANPALQAAKQATRGIPRTTPNPTTPFNTPPGEIGGEVPWEEMTTAQRITWVLAKLADGLDSTSSDFIIIINPSTCNNGRTMIGAPCAIY